MSYNLCNLTETSKLKQEFVIGHIRYLFGINARLTTRPVLTHKDRHEIPLREDNQIPKCFWVQINPK